jgi:hypothetical protein
MGLPMKGAWSETSAGKSSPGLESATSVTRTWLCTTRVALIG